MKKKKFKINNLIVKKKIFFSTANNLNNSIFIEACAGSGKTKLIIIRIIHLLIKYNNYKKILILTFTRIALKEIKKKIKKFFFYIININKKKFYKIFIKYGFLKKEIKKNYIKIKNLYKIFLFKNKKINFFTFHGWFLFFLKKNFFFKKKYNILENTEILINETYKKLLINLQKLKYKKYKKYFLKSIKILGIKNTKKILKKFIFKRDEWLLYNNILKKKKTTHLKEIKKICKKKKKKYILKIWKEKKFIKNINFIINIFNKLTPSYKKKSLILSKILISKPSIKQFKKLYNIFYTKYKKKRKINILKKKINFNLFKIKYYNIINILNINNKNYIFKYNKILFNIAKFFLKIYIKKKKKKKILDFIDLEFETYLLLNNNNKKKININFKHIIIDEFQDINLIQWKIINSIINLNKKQNNIKIFFVGDPKQSIYNFRKSDYRIFIYIKKFLKKNKIFLLQTNVTKRNSINIINIINNTLVKKNIFFQKQYTTNLIKGEVWKLPLINYFNKKKINNFKKKKIDIQRFKEGEQIAQSILLIKKKKLIYKKKIKRKIKWKDFLILIKTRKYLKEYEKAFKKYNIPFTSDKKKKIFNLFIINNLIILLKFLTTKNNKLLLIQILKSNFFLISKKDLKKISKIKEKKYKNFFLQKKYLFSKKTNFILIYLLKWIKYTKYFSIYNLLKKILKEYQLISLFYNKFIKNFKKIKNFFKFIFLYKNIKNITIEKFIIYIKNISNKKIYIKKENYFFKNTIHIVTIHKSKGLESPIVILPDTNHNNIIYENIDLLFNFPYDSNSKLHFSIFEKNKKYELIKKKFFNLEKKIKFQEYLNILYVALTRAKQLLIISGIKNKIINKKNIFKNWYQILFENNKKYKKISKKELFKKKKNIFYIKNKYFIKNNIYIKKKKIYIFISHILNKNKWPIKLPNIQNIKKYFSCSYKITKKILKIIINVLNNFKLEKFFNPKKFIKALNNVKIYKKKKKIICNRIVFFKKKIWILNYNLFILNNNSLLKNLKKILIFQKNFFLIFPSKFINSALILNNGKLIINK
ncbi:UvrD-helicase domain-containing protein [Candidatus Zinderia endosymbiont of Aphrophora alni]|uniref:UvrD-helicase domain-containing protein n=1 Tax=Candidatus Zinderia endosymbiont of Aphrophora alni TaxID=3077951 RepID=UPI0030CB229B